MGKFSNNDIYFAEQYMKTINGNSNDYEEEIKRRRRLDFNIIVKLYKSGNEKKLTDAKKMLDNLVKELIIDYKRKSYSPKYSKKLTLNFLLDEMSKYFLNKKEKQNFLNFLKQNKDISEEISI